MQITEAPAFLARWSLKAPRLVLFLGFLVTLAAGWLASGLALKNDIASLLPDKAPQVRLVREILEQMEGVGFQTVIAVSPDKKANRRFLKALKKRVLSEYWRPSHSALKTMQKDYERLGQLLRDSLQATDKASPTRLSQLKEQTRQLDQARLVEYAFHKNDRSFFEKRQLLFLTSKELKTLYERIAKKIKHELKKRQPGYVDLLGEPDPGLYTDDIEKKYKSELKKIPQRIEIKHKDNFLSGLLIRPLGAATDFAFSEKLVDTLNRLIKELDPKKFHPKMEISSAGPYVRNLREYTGASTELAKSFSITFVLLIALLLFFFRRKRVLLLIPVPLVMGTAWSFGLTYLTIGHLNVITGLIGALLLGLGVDYGVYLLDRYWTERRNGHDVETAIEISYRTTGAAITTAALTTSAGFFALLVCGFKGFSEFGFISGAGVLMCLTAMSTIMPALMKLLEDYKEQIPPAPLWTGVAVGGRRDFPFAKPLVGLALLVLLVVPFTIRYVPFEFNMKALSYQDDYFAVHEKRWKLLEPKVMQSISPILYKVSNEKQARALTKALQAYGDKHAKAHPKEPKMVREAYSIFRFVPSGQQDKMVWIRKIKTLLKRNNVDDFVEDMPKKAKFFKEFKPRFNVKPFTFRELPAALRRDLVFYDPDDFQKVKNFLVIVASDRDMFNGRVTQKVNEFLKPLKVEGKTWLFSGEGVIFAVLLDILTIEGAIAVIASLFVVALVVLLDLRNLRLMLLSLWPLMTGLLGMTILLVLLDVRLNIFNMLVLPALLGISVDSGVHILHRYRERPDLGTFGVQRDLFGPLSLASLTTVISFATSVTSKHLGMRSIGILAVIGLLVGLFAALVLLPALMELVFRRFPLKEHEVHMSSEDLAAVMKKQES